MFRQSHCVHSYIKPGGANNARTGALSTQWLPLIAKKSSNMTHAVTFVSQESWNSKYWYFFWQPLKGLLHCPSKSELLLWLKLPQSWAAKKWEHFTYRTKQRPWKSQQSCGSSAFPASSGVSFTEVLALCLSPGKQRLRAQQNHHSELLPKAGQKPAAATAAFPRPSQVHQQQRNNLLNNKQDPCSLRHQSQGLSSGWSHHHLLHHPTAPAGQPSPLAAGQS